MQAWVTGFQDANPDTTVSYDPVGSGGGREQFVAGGTVFAGSDSALADEELSGAQERCGGPDNLVEMPVYISPIALIYNLDGVDDLQLSSPTAAKIFNQKITNWNDPAIAADNPDATLPDQRITVVNRSDESGTTENFTDWLSQTAKARLAARGQRRLARQGRRGGRGHLGRRAGRDVRRGRDRLRRREPGRRPRRRQDQGRRHVRRADPGGGRQDGRRVQGVRRRRQVRVHVRREPHHTTAGTYPLILVSYQIACTKYDDADQGKVAGGLMQYIVSAEGQDAAAQAAGSAPISDQLRTQLEPAAKAVGGGA